MGENDIQLRGFDAHKDLAAVRDCVIELQDHEASIYSRLPPGSEVVDNCIKHMLEQCTKCLGKIIVAEVSGEVAGFVTVLCKVKSEEPDDGDLEYGLISDLVVKFEFRGHGVGRKLLDSAESAARAENVEWLRIGVIAGNQVAEKLYTSLGYSPWYKECEKDLRSPKIDEA